MSQTNIVSNETVAGSAPIQQSALREGMLLQDRYRIVRQLGKGGMGAVYEAIDERLEATVALKETFATDERLRRQFEQEARLLAQLSHPALPRVTDYFTEGARAFLIMQFISGVDLAEIIAKQPGPFPRNQVVAWADQLLDALMFLHTRERQITHRDIKPHNLKLTATGTIALLDFGLAKAAAADNAVGDTSISGYTRRYAPLEQIQDQGTTPQSDIYALGATLYHLLTGIKPADAVIREAALINSMPDPLRPANEVHAAVGLELAQVLAKATAQKAEDRYPTASEFREALAGVGRKRDEIQVQSTASEPSKSTKKDAFESYSILKPEPPTMFTNPPTVSSKKFIACIILALGVASSGAFYSFRGISSATLTNQQRRAGSSRVMINSTLNVPSHTMQPPTTISAGDITSAPNQRSRNSGDRRHPAMTTDEKRLNVVKSAVPQTRMPRADVTASDPAPVYSRLPEYGQRQFHILAVESNV
jgi:serine/threonine protein kinase